MKYDEDLQQYTYELNDLIFVWYEKPDEGYMEIIKKLSENYYKNLDSIIDYMKSDIEEVYGICSTDEIKSKLGSPQIDYDNGRVTYLNQTFDNIHIFEFEFLDDEFKDLQYFSIDG